MTKPATYFSSWDYTPLFALYGTGPAPCVARVTPDRELDAAFTTDMTEWTGGRYVMNFRYMRDGWGLADVLYHEELDADFSGELDPTVLDQIWDDGHFRLWKIDLEHGSAEPFDGIQAPGMGWSTATVDDRTYLFVPSDDWSSTTIYELDARGQASRKLELEGQATWARLR